MQHLSESLAGLVLFFLTVNPSSAQLINGGMEETDGTGAPLGWLLPPPVAATGWVVQGEGDDPAEGTRYVRLSPPKGGGGSFGNLLQVIPAAGFRDRRFALSAKVRVLEASAGARVQMWAREDREGGLPGFFDNMHDRPVRGEGWVAVRLNGELGGDALALTVGFMIVGGSATIDIDDVRLEILGNRNEGNAPPRALTDRGLENLVVLARLVGLLRYFHPSDEAAAADWDELTIRAVPAIEIAADREELQTRLLQRFAPITHSLQLGRDLARPVAPAAPGFRRVERDLELTWWEHHGVQGSQTPSIYRSTRVQKQLSSAEAEERLPPLDLDLARGLELVHPLPVQLPRALPILGGTASRPSWPASELDGARPNGWQPNYRDRSTRLAAVILAWNVHQHFYPYFDVVDTDWHASLVRALQKAAVDASAVAFVETLELLIADLHDGHGHVQHSSLMSPWTLPLQLAWVEGRIAIDRVGRSAPQGIAPGDCLVTIDGRPAGEQLEALVARTSGATIGWRRMRALQKLRQRRTATPVVLEVEDAGGKTTTVEVAPIGHEEIGPRDDVIEEVEEGIFYADLDRLTDAQLAAAIDDLQGAEGVIFDLRGYPTLSTVVLSHLIEKPIRSPQWHVPFVTLPNREAMEFRASGWPVMPRKPRIQGKVVFLTGPGAISYAETYLGMVEHYELAEIVGQTTAGTNGNVNTYRLPGGASVTWTGMKVLKHDGSRHHGVGILPTIPVERTLEGLRQGRDEFLERAVELIRKER